MAKAKFGDLYADFVVKHPQKAGRALADLRRRRAELAAGGTPRSKFDTVESLGSQIVNYTRGFRVAGKCQALGCDLEDPVSVWRGYGPDCWARLTDEQRSEAEAIALELLGPCPSSSTSRAIVLDPEEAW